MEPTKFCSACGAQNRLSAKFCQGCGAQYQALALPRPRQTWRSAFSPLLVIVLGFFGCCAVGSIATLIRSDKTPPRTSLENSPAPTSSVSRPLWSPTPDLPPPELLARAKTILAKPYDRIAYNGAIDLLSRIPPDAKEHKQSIPLRQKAIKAHEREIAAEEAANRKLGADNVERGLLSQGYDATVTVSGPGNSTIKITYVLMGRPMVYQLVEKGVLDQLRSQGFRKVIFSDGYGKTWWYNL